MSHFFSKKLLTNETKWAKTNLLSRSLVIYKCQVSILTDLFTCLLNFLKWRCTKSSTNGRLVSVSVLKLKVGWIHCEDKQLEQEHLLSKYPMFGCVVNLKDVPCVLVLICRSECSLSVSDTNAVAWILLLVSSIYNHFLN